ncbi:substrate-binding periplasmic protein [Tannockella kyphosi]|uniref:substrate-binding periplasmic protein n=1 Tax=Tannockella kyphosi TaxID=2899121 RepID=UPI0020114799|nr:transporter substrate-binding domain-containing protein [Tannockella kyphosi]
MKKLWKVLLASFMVVGLVGCSSDEESSEDETVMVYVGISPDYPPYESEDTDGNIVGFDPDMLEILEVYMNEGDTQYEFELVSMSFDNIVTQIQADQITIGLSGFTYSEDRAVEWSIPYTATSQVAVVNADSDITSIDDLEGKTLGAQTSTTGEDAANSVTDAEVVSLSDVKMLFEGLNSYAYDAVIVDIAVAQEYADASGYVVLEESLMDEMNYIIAKEGNTEIIDALDAALEKFIASDDYDSLTTTYGLKKLTD